MTLLPSPEGVVLMENVGQQPAKKGFLDSLRDFYDKKYKALLIIPFVMFITALALIGMKIAQTGDFMNKDVSLKGGVTITIPTDAQIEPLSLENALKGSFPGNDITVRALSQFGTQIGVIVQADVAQGEVSGLLDSIRQATKLKLKANDYTAEVIGSTLGQSFFREAFKALIFAFIAMAIVVFIYFRTFVPSMAVVLAAFSDIVVTLAVVNLMGMRIGTAGIAAFLMLIGYSVDTDILLSTRVLKRKEGSVMDRVLSSVTTGMTMTMTSIVAVTVALLFAQSDTIRQIMTILLIGLIADIINTWIQNVGILRLYLERKQAKAEQLK